MAMLTLNELSYVVRSRPLSGKVDLAAAFFDRSFLRNENVYFNDFKGWHCPGCQDGNFIEFLYLHRNWEYLNLANDGLKSMIFHGPSPTWCIASGNVWFDHPHVNSVKCYNIVRINRLLHLNRGNRFDWGYYHQSGHMCLRFS